MIMIIGLGNPGDKYKNNRHNAGFLYADYFNDRHSIGDWKKKDNYKYVKGLYNGEVCILIKPQTYMNLSGEAVVKAMGFFKVERRSLLVVYDDIALPFGTIRVRERGSPGGHNGLKNIQLHLGGEEYQRVRIGVDPPEFGGDLINHVLGDFTSDDLKLLNETVFDRIDEVAALVTAGSIKEAMNKYNGK